MQKREPKKRLKYTVMMVPNNAHRVKQFHISFDFIIVLSIVVFALIFGAVSYVTYSASEMERMQALVDAEKDQTKNMEDANILLQAQIEELNNSLRDAKVELDAKETAAQNQEKAVSMQFIPNGFPVDGTVAMPTEYTAETQYVVFTAGIGTKVVASADGTVTSVNADADYGYVTEIDHGNGYVTIYKNLSEPVVGEGDKVIRGTTLAVMSTEEETLTYQITFGGELIDPMEVIEIKG